MASPLPVPHPTSRPLAVAAACCLLVLALAGPARADFAADSTVAIQNAYSTSSLGTFTGSVAVQNVSTTQAVIQIALTNTSPVANGGYITALAFNNPNNEITGVTSFTQAYNPAGAPPANNMVLIGGSNFQNTISGSPYGSFDIGAAVGGNFLGGGNPMPGVEVGQTGTFTFTVTGTGLNTLTAQQLLDTLSANPQGGGAAPLLVRYRGFLNGGSDKVVAGVVCTPPVVVPPPPPSGVPAPPSVVLAGLAFGCGLLGRGFRRRTARAAA